MLLFTQAFELLAVQAANVEFEKIVLRTQLDFQLIESLGSVKSHYAEVHQLFDAFGMSLMSTATNFKSELRLEEGHLEPAFENRI